VKAVDLGSRLLKTILVIVALFETALLALFAVFALSGDELGIARAMLIALAVPYALLTVPGILLVARGQLLIASILVGASVPLTWLVWFLA
jgi:hypothetical protein